MDRRINRGMNVVAETNHFLSGFKAPIPNTLIGPRNDTDHRPEKESIAIILLNEHRTKPIPNGLYPYTCRLRSLSALIRGASFADLWLDGDQHREP